MTPSQKKKSYKHPSSLTIMTPTLPLESKQTNRWAAWEEAGIIRLNQLWDGKQPRTVDSLALSLGKKKVQQALQTILHSLPAKRLLTLSADPLPWKKQMWAGSTQLQPGQVAIIQDITQHSAEVLTLSTQPFDGGILTLDDSESISLDIQSLYEIRVLHWRS